MSGGKPRTESFLVHECSVETAPARAVPSLEGPCLLLRGGPLCAGHSCDRRSEIFSPAICTLACSGRVSKCQLTLVRHGLNLATALSRGCGESVVWEPLKWDRRVAISDSVSRFHGTLEITFLFRGQKLVYPCSSTREPLGLTQIPLDSLNPRASS